MKELMKELFSIFMVGFCLAFCMQMYAYGEESIKDKTAETGRDIKKGAKKLGRNVQDKTCELVNGKMQCLGKKIKHGAQNMGDEISDKVDDVKD